MYYQHLFQAGISMHHAISAPTDDFEYLDPKRLTELKNSWAEIFRKEILPELHVKSLRKYYHKKNGRPSKEMYAMLGLMILQQMKKLIPSETYTITELELRPQSQSMIASPVSNIYVSEDSRRSQFCCHSKKL